MYGAKIARVASVVGAQQDRTWGSPNQIRDEKVQRSSVLYSLSLICHVEGFETVMMAYASTEGTASSKSKSTCQAWRYLRG